MVVLPGAPAWPSGDCADEDGRVTDSDRVQLRVGLAQIDTRVGDLQGNAQLVRDWTARAAGDGVHLVVFPEMTLTGYPAEDLVLRGAVERARWQRVLGLATWLAEEVTP